MEKPRRVPGRDLAGISDQAAVAADVDRRSAAAHFRPDLWLSAAIQRRCRIPRTEDRRGPESGNAAVDGRRSCQNSAGVLARRGLELFGLHRCHRLSCRQDQRKAVRTVSERTYLRSARHERYRLFCTGRQGASFRGLLLRRSKRRHDVSCHRAQRQPDAAGRPDRELFPLATVVHLRRRRIVFDRGRLSHLLPGGRDLPAMSRSLFSEATYNGIGFGLGFSVTMDPAQTLIPGSAGEYAWGGAATTSFWIDPAEELIAIFMTQVLPSSAYPLRRELRTMVYAGITESNL